MPYKIYDGEHEPCGDRRQQYYLKRTHELRQTEQRPRLKHYERRQPCYEALRYHHAHRPLRAQLPLHGSYRRHAGGI